MNINDWIEYMRTLLGLSTDIKKKKVCKKCGETIKHSIHCCSTKCKKKLSSMRTRKQTKMLNRFLKNPSICPVCNKRKTRLGGFGKEYKCRKCGHHSYY